MEEAEPLLPTLVQAGYAEVDDEASTWWLSDRGVKRAKAIEARHAEWRGSTGENALAWASVRECPLS
jgi:hypothetical protein